MGARLFTAILPDADVAADLDAFLQPRREAEPRLRWTRPELWHLTTSFMGDVPDRSHDRLVENLAEVAARTPPVHVALRGAGAFPYPVAARHLWVGVVDPEPLARLARRCRTAAERAGVRVDGARFVPHLTLARANRPLDATRVVRVLDAWEGGSWRADELVLIASHLHDRANRYEVVERFALDGDDGGDDGRASGGPATKTAGPADGTRP